MHGRVGLETGLSRGSGTCYSFSLDHWILHLSLVFFWSSASNVPCLKRIVVGLVSIVSSWLRLRTLNFRLFHRPIQLLLRRLAVVIDLRVVHAIPHMTAEAHLLDIGQLSMVKSPSRGLALLGSAQDGSIGVDHRGILDWVKGVADLLALVCVLLVAGFGSGDIIGIQRVARVALPGLVPVLWLGSLDIGDIIGLLRWHLLYLHRVIVHDLLHAVTSAQVHILLTSRSNSSSCSLSTELDANFFRGSLGGTVPSI